MKSVLKAPNRPQWITVSLYCLILLLLLSFERVVGLPILFLGLALQEFVLASSTNQRLIAVAIAIALAVFYQISFLLGLAMLGIGLGVWFSSGFVSSSKTARLFVSVLVIVLALSLQQGITFSLRTLFYLSCSSLVLLFMTRTNQKYL